MTHVYYLINLISLGISSGWFVYADRHLKPRILQQVHVIRQNSNILLLLLLLLLFLLLLQNLYSAQIQASYEEQEHIKKQVRRLMANHHSEWCAEEGRQQGFWEHACMASQDDEEKQPKCLRLNCGSAAISTEQSFSKQEPE